MMFTTIMLTYIELFSVTIYQGCSYAMTGSPLVKWAIAQHVTIMNIEHRRLVYAEEHGWSDITLRE